MLKEHYTLKDFLPLIIPFMGIFLIAGYVFVTNNFNIELGMRIFMAGFFIVFGVLKIIRLRAFAQVYQMYDVLAKRSVVYAYLYPFIELALGVAYLFYIAPLIVNWVTLVVMLISALGVYLQLQRNERIMCACLGTVFKIPMTWATLFEDLLMAAMAALMLLFFV